MSEGLRIRVVLVVVTGIAVVPSLGHSQGLLFGNVDGFVRIQGGDAGMVRVQLQRLGTTVQERFSADGHFTFWNVPYGPYTLSIRVPGHDPVSQEISVPGESYLTIEIGTRTRISNSAVMSVSELQIPRSARRQYEQAQDRFRKGDCARALTYLSEAVRLFRDYADAHNAIGNCQVRLQEPSLAEQAFRRAIELTPSVYPALNLADLYIKQARLDEADAVLTRAVRRNPTQGDAYYGLALLRVEQHRLDEAEKLADQAHGYPKHIADVHLLLAKLHQRQGRLDLIPADLKHYVIEAEPNPTRDQIQKMLIESESDQ
jgi:tetratricopeptide (TPR) repeat protein